MALKLNPNTIEHCKAVTSGNSTSDGIRMLKLDDATLPREYAKNYAGNYYLDALRMIKYLLEQLGEDDILYDK